MSFNNFFNLCFIWFPPGGGKIEATFDKTATRILVQTRQHLHTMGKKKQKEPAPTAEAVGEVFNRFNTTYERDPVTVCKVLASNAEMAASLIHTLSFAREKTLLLVASAVESGYSTVTDEVYAEVMRVDGEGVLDSEGGSDSEGEGAPKKKKQKTVTFATQANVLFSAMKQVGEEWEDIDNASKTLVLEMDIESHHLTPTNYKRVIQTLLKRVNDSSIHSLLQRFFFGRALAYAHTLSPSGKEFERLCREEFGVARNTAYAIIGFFRVASVYPTILGVSVPWRTIREHVSMTMKDGTRVMSPLLSKITNLPDEERAIFRTPFPNTSVSVGGVEDACMIAGDIVHPHHEAFFHNSASEGDGGNLSAVGLPPLNKFTHSDATTSTFSAKDGEGNEEDSDGDWTPDQCRAV